ncbi:MAG: hypothetical protein JWM44_1941 [Bacilli bacterium]|nr:hypothetical protein [Bacilli bacterium]
MMEKRIKSALRHAECWLLSLPPETAAGELQLQRFFAICLVQASLDKRDFHQQSRLKWLNELYVLKGDTFLQNAKLTLALHVVLQRYRISSPELTAVADHCAALLNAAQEPLDAEFNALTTLLRYSGQNVPEAVPFTDALNSLEVWVALDRNQVKEACRRIHDVTSYGHNRIHNHHAAAILSTMAASYALDRDLEMVCLILHTRAYFEPMETGAGIHDCAVEWLLDQQKPDGSFGWLTTEIGYRVSASDIENTALQVSFTVMAIWTLVEWKHPGFLYLR